MTQPDAFEKMVMQVMTRIAPRGKAVVHCADVRMLLRRQHAKILAMVKRETRWQLDSWGHLTTMPDGEWINRDTLIKALAKMKKGKP